MYAGRDGNVYRNDGSGWQQYDKGGWNNAERPAGTSGQRATAADNAGAQARASQASLNASMQDQLNRDRAARDEGAQRVNDLGGINGGGLADRAGSYRPSGGGSGGAGGVLTRGG